MQFNKHEDFENVNFNKSLEKAQEDKKVNFTILVPKNLKNSFEDKIWKDNAEARKYGEKVTIKQVIMELMQRYIDGDIKLLDS